MTTTNDRAHRAHPTAAVRREQAEAVIDRLSVQHCAVLEGALRSPSAHNAQPWRIRPVATDEGWCYELHYDHHEYLPTDPDDRDAYLCMGAFCETLALTADRLGLLADIDLVLQRDDADLHVADVRLTPAARRDPLSPHVAARATNRTVYRPDPLPQILVAELESYGCTLVPTSSHASPAAPRPCRGPTDGSSPTSTRGSVRTPRAPTA